MAVRGRRSIFRDKPLDSEHRHGGYVSRRGHIKFEEARERLAKIAGRKVTSVGDGDVMEYLARGAAETREYLKSLG